MPENLASQIPYIKKIIEGYRIALLEKEGFEADDLIGTVARRLESEVDVVIVTGTKTSFNWSVTGFRSTTA